MAEESDEELLLRLLKRCAAIGEHVPAHFAKTPEEHEKINRELDMMQRMIREGFAEGSMNDTRISTPTGVMGGRSGGLTKVLPKGLKLLAPYIPAAEKQIQGMADDQIDAELSRGRENDLWHDLLRAEKSKRDGEKARIENAEKQKVEAESKRRHAEQILWAKIGVGVAVAIALGSAIPWALRQFSATPRPVPIPAAPPATPTQTPIATTPSPTTGSTKASEPSTPVPATPVAPPLPQPKSGD